MLGFRRVLSKVKKNICKILRFTSPYFTSVPLIYKCSPYLQVFPLFKSVPLNVSVRRSVECLLNYFQDVSLSLVILLVDKHVRCGSFVNLVSVSFFGFISDC